MPLKTALGPARRVIRNVTLPETFQTRYWPPRNEDTVRLSSTFPLASSTSMRSLRAAPFQSSRYRATWCLWPSVTLTFMLKLLAAYQAAAMRPRAGLDRARTSVVDLAHTLVDWPLGVTVA